MQCGLSLCVNGKCSVVCHCVLRLSAYHRVFKRVSAVWSVIVVLRG